MVNGTVGVGPAANQAMQQPIPGYFPGPMVAGLNPFQVQGMEDTYNTMQGFNASMMPGAMQTFNQGMGGLMDYVEGAGEINPYLDQMAGAYTSAAGRALDRMIPQQELNMINSGNMGSDRHGIAEGLLRSDANSQLQEQLAQLYGQGYESAANRGLNAWQSVPGALSQGLGTMGGLMDMMTQPSRFMTDAGGFLQNQANAQLQGEQARWNYLQQAPWDRINQYAGVVGGMNPGATTTGTNPNYLGPLGGAAAGLAGMDRSVWDAAFGPGAAIGQSGLGAGTGYTGGFGGLY